MERIHFQPLIQGVHIGELGVYLHNLKNKYLFTSFCLRMNRLLMPLMLAVGLFLSSCSDDPTGVTETLPTTPHLLDGKISYRDGRLAIASISDWEWLVGNSQKKFQDELLFELSDLNGFTSLLDIVKDPSLAKTYSHRKQYLLKTDGLLIDDFFLVVSGENQNRHKTWAISLFRLFLG